FVLSFPSPVLASSGGGRISLTAPQVNYTYDDNQPVVTIDRHVAVDLNYTNPALQQLGLGTLPVRLDYNGFTFTPIQFTLFVNGAQIPVAISAADLTSAVHTIEDLVKLLQTRIDSAVADAVAGGALTAGPHVITVCR